MVIEHKYSYPRTIQPFEALRGQTILFELRINSRSHPDATQFVFSQVLNAVATIQQIPLFICCWQNATFSCRYVVSANSGKKQSLEEMLVAKLHILQELH